ncbi:class I SAM-dependent methyltransferase [Gramella jeungdoensis]|uniref:Class I SAM-dependent methyltransferase n=1 Tax=Gramella jeungdoensis TaxID=708091 RepID=A0ABT0YYU1_9FLAO|nr:class I SAM-dependent methyltransferase [Gramella jeungdoensis]MCM8568651.1 class I SAM-dependent methyltransferase [Gramella jeungdoensis]
MKETENTRAIFNKYAEGYQDKYMDVGLYHESLDLFCENLNSKQTEILEIGCGPGNLTKYLLSLRPDLKILGIDLASKMIDLARQNNPEAEFRTMDCRDISQLNQKFDGILCGFCLPYLSQKETIKLIEDMFALLNPGGIVYLSTMEADHKKSGYEGSSSAEEKLYINYYESDYLLRNLDKQGFRIIKIYTLENPVNKEGIRDLVIIAKKIS